MQNEELHYWIALSLIEDIGPVMAKRLINIFQKPERIFNATEHELRDIEGIGDKRIKAIREFRRWKDVEETIRRCRDLDISIITLNDPVYPENLKNINDPPSVLYIRGSPQERDRYAVAIVGSRRPTEYGRRVAEKLSRDLAELGITIVSGLARGIDTVAHSGSLKSGGRTIGVFASGLDRVYPPENKGLVRRIMEGGYVVSEFPPGTPPNRENFPRRNRLISGLSLAVVVVEAGAESGALITAATGLDQGREIFAVPGSILSKNSAGTNNLIKRGAKPVTSVEDIIEELAPALKGLSGYKKRKEKVWELEFTDKERDIIKIITEEPLHIDDIARRSKRPVSEVAAILLDLELKGVVRQIEGKRFEVC